MKTQLNETRIPNEEMAGEAKEEVGSHCPREECFEHNKVGVEPH